MNSRSKSSLGSLYSGTVPRTRRNWSGSGQGQGPTSGSEERPLVRGKALAPGTGRDTQDRYSTYVRAWGKGADQQNQWHRSAQPQGSRDPRQET